MRRSEAVPSLVLTRSWKQPTGRRGVPPKAKAPHVALNKVIILMAVPCAAAHPRRTLYGTDTDPRGVGKKAAGSSHTRRTEKPLKRARHIIYLSSPSNAPPARSAACGGWVGVTASSLLDRNPDFPIERACIHATTELVIYVVQAGRALCRARRIGCRHPGASLAAQLIDPSLPVECSAVASTVENLFSSYTVRGIHHHFVEKTDRLTMNAIEVPAGTGSGFLWDKDAASSQITMSSVERRQPRSW